MEGDGKGEGVGGEETADGDGKDGGATEGDGKGAGVGALAMLVSGSSVGFR